MAEQTHEEAALDLLTRSLTHLKLAKSEAILAGDKQRKMRIQATIAQVNLAVANLMTKGMPLEEGAVMMRAGGNMTVFGSVTGGDKIENHKTNVTVVQQSDNE